ncbi:hypothetical protein ScalyP_jg12009 [Parmales sp. scaly parma]|nr:hypothetical protein ScalyP_jg12009 [Parmales sp. scaly parma]
MLLRLRDVNDDSTQGETENYFLGRNRKFQVVVQGKFKKKIKVSDVLTGHEFCKPLKRLPHHLILDAAEKLICMLAPSTIVELGLKYPRALSILGATSQVVSIDEMGSQPDIEKFDILESNRWFGGPLFMNPKEEVTAAQRKKILSNTRHNQLFEYDTDHVYTFDFFQHLLDVSNYALNVKIANVKLVSSLDGQPIQIMAKTKTGEYLWNFQLWHEDLL